MRPINFPPIRMTVRLIIFFILFLSIFNVKGQSDTLHLNYKGFDPKMPDSTEAKIVEWAKKLKGKHVYVNVVAYYNQSEYKKFSVERADEAFLILNRKARELITIESYGAKKGQKSQRSRVDVIYRFTLTPGKVTNDGDEEKADDNAVVTKDSDKKATATSTAAVNKAFVEKDEFKTRKLMVVLLSENPEVVQRIGKNNTNELTNYRNNLKTYNDNITKAFKNNWKETQVEVITEAELKANKAVEKLMGWTLLLPDKKQLEKLDFMQYKVSMIYKKGKGIDMKQKQFKVSTPNGIPEEGDFVLLMHKMKVYYGLQPEYDRSQLDKALASKTLYVDKESTELSEEEFKEGYPFPVKFTSSQEISSISDKKTANALYIRSDVNNDTVNVMIVDAQTGTILSRTALEGSVKVSANTPSNAGGFGSNLILFNGKTLTFELCSSCQWANLEAYRENSAKAMVTKSMLKSLVSPTLQMKHKPLVID